MYVALTIIYSYDLANIKRLASNYLTKQSNEWMNEENTL